MTADRPSRSRPDLRERYDPFVPDPQSIITSGHEIRTGRTVAIYRGDTINEEALLAMSREIIAHNRAGGWRKLKQRDSRPMR
jgi:hypothetical protein